MRATPVAKCAPTCVFCQKEIIKIDSDPDVYSCDHNGDSQGPMASSYVHDAESARFYNEKMRATIDANRDLAVQEATAPLVEWLGYAERKLTAYVGVCPGDKELTTATLPGIRKVLAPYTQPTPEEGKRDE